MALCAPHPAAPPNTVRYRSLLTADCSPSDFKTSLRAVINPTSRWLSRCTGGSNSACHIYIWATSQDLWAHVSCFPIFGPYQTNSGFILISSDAPLLGRHLVENQTCHRQHELRHRGTRRGGTPHYVWAGQNPRGCHFYDKPYPEAVRGTAVESLGIICRLLLWPTSKEPWNPTTSSL